MKITIYLFSLLVITTPVSAQNSRPIATDNVKMLNPGKTYLNAINTRAIRDFICKYETATDVNWYTVPGGFIARFIVDSMSARAAYRSNGNWVYTIKQYQEAKMSRAVRHLIKSTYYDYSITLVEEIDQPNQPVKYLVHLQDDVSWKNVLVFDGQLELVEDKKKL